MVMMQRQLQEVGLTNKAGEYRKPARKPPGENTSRDSQGEPTAGSSDAYKARERLVGAEEMGKPQRVIPKTTNRHDPDCSTITAGSSVSIGYSDQIFGKQKAVEKPKNTVRWQLMQM